MERLIRPSFQTRPYKPSEVVRVRDRFQQYKYLLNNVYPVDMYESKDDVIMVFLKEDTKELFIKWRNKEL